MAIRCPKIYTQHSGEPEPVVQQTTLGQFARMESHFPDMGMSGIAAFIQGGLRYYAYLGWLHRKQSGQDVGGFEAWADELVDMGLGVPREDGDEDDEDPTEADPEP